MVISSSALSPSLRTGANDRKMTFANAWRRISHPSSEQYRALSISTLLAEQAIQEENEQKFHDSHIGLLMKAIYDKVGSDVIQLKINKPKISLNTFIEDVVNGSGADTVSIHGLIEEMDRVTNEIRRYQQGIDQSVDLILRKVKQDVRNQIQSLSSTWSAQIDQQGW